MTTWFQKCHLCAHILVNALLLPPSNVPVLTPGCNDSHYQVVIANTPANSLLVPKTHLHVDKYSSARVYARKSYKRLCVYGNVTAL